MSNGSKYPLLDIRQRFVTARNRAQTAVEEMDHIIATNGDPDETLAEAESIEQQAKVAQKLIRQYKDEAV
jgi:hypothetical protein